MKVSKIGSYIRRFIEDRVKRQFEDGMVKVVSDLSPDQLHKCIVWDMSLWQLVPEQQRLKWKAEAAEIKEQYCHVIQAIGRDEILTVLRKERPDLIVIIESTPSGLLWLDKLLTEIRAGLNLD